MLIVVARYNESIDWTKSYNCIIYNKGDPIEASKVTTLPNVGREGHTYLHHIINNYDTLSDYTMFLQGNPFDHTPYLESNIMGSLFTNRSLPFTYNAVNSYNLTVTYPAIYLLSVTVTATTNGGSTSNLSGLVYILLNASGSMNTYAVIVNGGVSVNSFTPNTTTSSSSTINISLGHDGTTINSGGYAFVNLLRIN